VLENECPTYDFWNGANGVGVAEVATYTVKRLDNDYFGDGA